MEGFWKNVRKVVPYTPGEQPKEKDIIKLNTNENPYPPSEAVMKKAEKIRDLRRYPDPHASELVEAIAAYKGLKKEQIFTGVGSDDVLAMCFLTFFNGKEPILFPDITYSFYDVWAGLFQIPYEKVPLDASFRIIPDDYKKPNGGIIFPNPNAPTGIELESCRIEEILKANPDVIVIVDEAYVDFGAESAQKLLDQYKNLIVVQTFSKSRSMAGLRIGYAMAHPELISALNHVKHSYNSYTMNQPSIVLGKASLEDEEYFQWTRKKIMETRTWFGEELKKLGFSFYESRANFIFASHERIPAKEIFEAARAEGIYVRYFDQPRISNYLRITIGTREEMERFLQFLESFTGKAPAVN